MNDSTVSSILPLRLLSGVGGVLPLDAVLVYDANDPLAVSALFDTGAEKPVRWTFARDLLHEGLHRRVGEGDIVVWPAIDNEGEPAVNLRLCSPDGDALLEAPAVVIEDFLDRSAKLVALGDEAPLIDVDAALQAILDGIA
jgi:hypothetical protein